MANFKNKTVYVRAPKDDVFTFNRISSSVTSNPKLNYCEKSIMVEILSHSDDYVINKGYIRKVLQMPYKKFADSWASLEEKYYINAQRFFGGTKYVINEKGNYIYPNELDSSNSDTDILNTDIKNTDVTLHTIKKTTINQTNSSTQDLKSWDRATKVKKATNTQKHKDGERDSTPSWTSSDIPIEDMPDMNLDIDIDDVV